LVDLDGDGKQDLISGSWPGELFFFKGKGKGDFEAPVKLKGKDGKTINIGGGRRPDSDDGMLLIAGDAKFEQKDGKQFIVYEDEWIPVPEGGNAGITGTASAVHAHDWDGDGDFDLIVGDIRGGVYLVPNEGSRTEWSFGKEQQLKAGGQNLTVNGGDAGPFVADWDGDQKADLLVGAGDGSVMFYRNTAGEKGTELAAGRALVPAAEGIQHGPEAPAEARRGMRAKVCAADWNGDGRLDLMLGDFTTQKPAPRELSAEEKAEHERIRKELEPIQKQYQEASQRYFESRRDKKLEPAQREKIQKEFGELSQHMWKLREKLPPEYENHGWVWLFLRKGDVGTARADTPEGNAQPAAGD
jgi:hypothetical protein